MASRLIHSSAIIDENADIGRDVEIGPFTIIHKNVCVGDGCKIEGYCELGYPNPRANQPYLEIGAKSHIRSHSIFYLGSTFGSRLTTGHRVTVRENVIAGSDLSIGTLSDIQGDCSFGNFVRLHSNVHIGKLAIIGNYVWIYPYVVLTNDPHPPSETLIGVVVEDYAVIATMSVILPGVVVKEHSLVAAHSLVRGDVPSGIVVGGVPAKALCETKAIKLTGKPDVAAYPWTSHLSGRFPEEVVKSWSQNSEG